MVWDLCALCESLLYIENNSMSPVYQSNLIDCCTLMLLGFLASLAPNVIELEFKYDYLTPPCVGISANDAPMSLIDELKTHRT